MSKKKKEVTPPPRRMTQELFIMDDNGETIPTVEHEQTPPAEPSAPDAKAPSKDPISNGGSTGKPPAGKTPSGSDDDFDIPDPDINPDEEIIPLPVVFAPASSGPLARIMDANFLEFASYTICNRAIPTVEDGLKPVQRRILHSLFEKNDGRFIKVANIIGHTMQYHPHGDASIGEALVNLTTKRYLIEGQGNFGNIYTGDGAAAPRYIECRLTPLARDEIFNKKTTNFIPSYDGRNHEPLLLPSKLPLLLMLGAEGRSPSPLKSGTMYSLERGLLC